MHLAQIFFVRGDWMKRVAVFRRFIRRKSKRIVKNAPLLTVFNQPKINNIGLSEAEYKLIYPYQGMECYTLTDQCSRLPLQQTTFKILVWNLHKGKELNWQDALQVFGSECDFILLQEVVESNGAEDLWGKQAMYGIHAGSYAYRDDMSGGMLISPHLPNMYCVGSGREPWTRIPKISLAAFYPLTNNKQLLLVNLHLVNFELGGINYAEQLNQAFQLIEQHNGPLILAGDFNSWSRSRLELLEQLAEKFAMQDVTFKKDTRKLFFGKPLDHIYVRGLTITDAEVIDTPISDHNPMSITVEIQK